MTDGVMSESSSMSSMAGLGQDGFSDDDGEPMLIRANGGYGADDRPFTRSQAALTQGGSKKAA